MEFTTIVIGDKRSQIRIEALQKYDIYLDVPTIAKEHNVFIPYKGKLFFDIIGLCDPWNFAISERFKALLEENGIKGWACYPIKIENTSLKYYIFDVKGKAGIICKYDKYKCMVHGTIQIDTTIWDGSDIFNIGDTGIIVCTEKVKELIQKNKITNVEFEDLSKY